MSSKLFIGNLDWNTEKDEFQSHFSQYGDIDDIHIVTDKETGRSRGFGFVTYLNQDSADEAIKNLDNTEFKGRTIAVKMADNKGERLRCNGRNGNNDCNIGYGNRNANGSRNSYGYNNNGRGGGYSNSRRGNSRYSDSKDRCGSNTPRYEMRGQW